MEPIRYEISNSKFWKQFSTKCPYKGNDIFVGGLKCQTCSNFHGIDMHKKLVYCQAKAKLSPQFVNSCDGCRFQLQPRNLCSNKTQCFGYDQYTPEKPVKPDFPSDQVITKGLGSEESIQYKYARVVKEKRGLIDQNSQLKMEISYWIERMKKLQRDLAAHQDEEKELNDRYKKLKEDLINAIKEVGETRKLNNELTLSNEELRRKLGALEIVLNISNPLKEDMSAHPYEAAAIRHERDQAFERITQLEELVRDMHSECAVFEQPLGVAGMISKIDGLCNICANQPKVIDPLNRPEACKTCTAIVRLSQFKKKEKE